jgi:hypothetical protein
MPLDRTAQRNLERRVYKNEICTTSSRCSGSGAIFLNALIKTGQFGRAAPGSSRPAPSGTQLIRDQGSNPARIDPGIVLALGALRFSPQQDRPGSKFLVSCSTASSQRLEIRIYQSSLFEPDIDRDCFAEVQTSQF